MPQDIDVMLKQMDKMKDTNFSMSTITFDEMPDSYFKCLGKSRAAYIGKDIVMHFNVKMPMYNDILFQVFEESAYNIELTDFEKLIPGEKHEYRYGARFKDGEIISAKEFMRMFFKEVGQK